MARFYFDQESLVLKTIIKRDCRLYAVLVLNYELRPYVRSSLSPALISPMYEMSRYSSFTPLPTHLRLFFPSLVNST